MGPASTRAPLGHLLAVAVGGAVGGTARFALVEAFPLGPGAFPWVILGENLTGAFLLAALLTSLAAWWPLSWDPRPFLATGVLGSFTTFSNLSLDVVALAAGGSWALAALYSAASLFLGLAAAVLGMRVGERLARRPLGGAA